MQNQINQVYNSGDSCAIYTGGSINIEENSYSLERYDELLLSQRSSDDGDNIEGSELKSSNTMKQYTEQRDLECIEQTNLALTKGSNYWMTIFNTLNTLTGFGILSVPYATSQGGWLSLIFLIGIALICFYTGILVQRCMDSDAQIKTYPDIGLKAFGRWGKALIAFLLYMELFLLTTELLISLGDNMEKLLSKNNFNIGGLHISSKKIYILLGANIILPTTWLRSLKLLSYLSFTGVLGFSVVIISVLWASIESVGFHEHGEIVNWRGFGTCIGLYTFCYGGHTILPTIYTDMKNKRLFPYALVVSFLFATVCYSFMATIGYLAYGDNLKSQVTLSLPIGNISSKVAILTSVMIPLVKYGLMVTPIAEAIEVQFQMLHIWSILTVRTLIVLGTVIVALSVPFFGSVVALSGSFFTVGLSLILPCVCYLKIFTNSHKRCFELVLIITIIVLGVIVAIVGTYTSVKKIINAF
ncbi:amino acid transporter AVT1I-like [Zingiber officinale]|uniref:amino acid transporter AVT1I-like n=1 Tax=Zingiber officinale TaxID=94328 RepID=UPI001C4DC2D1|nr:amino acid transporter AVT1I-like [Zingiber officinale]